LYFFAFGCGYALVLPAVQTIAVPMRRRRFVRVHILVFLAPAVLIYTAFMIYPLFDSLWLSLNNKGATANQVFVGIQNYQTLFGQEQWSKPFWNALRNNAIFFLIHMLVQNPVGLMLAALLGARIRGGAIYRSIIFTPTILSVVIVGFVWKLILNPAWGISRSVLAAVGLSALDHPWLGLESSALITLSLISVWQNIGIPMMLFLAALIRVPDELMEAARVDGAGVWKIFWKIQFPLILPTVGIVAVLTFVGNFNAFELIYATQGALAGPNFASDILGTFFFRTFFGRRHHAPHHTDWGFDLPVWLATAFTANSVLGAKDGKTEFSNLADHYYPHRTVGLFRFCAVPSAVDNPQFFQRPAHYLQRAVCAAGCGNLYPGRLPNTLFYRSLRAILPQQFPGHGKLSRADRCGQLDGSLCAG
jgi:raffinose/stachyose/melibiose transport system permease protein